MKCGYYYEDETGATACKKCGHIYVEWLNWEDIVDGRHPDDISPEQSLTK